MKTFFIAILVAFIAIDCTVGYHGPLKSAKSSNSVAWTDACDECQTIIKRIVEVAKDPTKVAELKLLLSELCRETSYVEECKLFVSKLDLFLERLLPFLSDAHHVCQELHICRNRKLKQFHRVGMLFTRKFLNKKEAKESLLCEECQFAAQELLTLVDNPTIQQKVQDWLEEEVCEHMGRFKDTCNEYVEVILPDFWQEMHTILADQKQFCVDLELCPPSLVDNDDERDSIRPEKISGKLIEMMKENEN